ncbi:helix-turn-helix domain-containing protein [Gallibacterium anatis]|uniref:helix-turn-helix domain-containing protein n=1 Tax=Gallibacterium anatis TaxID=750 RepID=UPI0039FCDB92
MIFFDSKAIIERMKLTCGVTGDKELASLIGTYPSTLSGWRNRNALPAKEIFAFANQHNISLDWLVYGKPDTLNDTDKLCLAAFHALDDEQKLQALGFLTGLKTQKSNGINQSAGGNVTNMVAGNMKK